MFYLAVRLYWPINCSQSLTRNQLAFLQNSVFNEKSAGSIHRVTTYHHHACKRNGHFSAKCKQMLSTLQKQGYVILQDSEADRRSQTVEMTIKGKRNVRTNGPVHFLFAELFNGISGKKLRAAKVVIKLIENLKKCRRISSDTNIRKKGKIAITVVAYSSSSYCCCRENQLSKVNEITDRLSIYRKLQTAPIPDIAIMGLLRLG